MICENEIMANQFILISQIYTGDNRYDFSYDKTYKLLCTIDSFIKTYPDVFNVDSTLENILIILNKLLEELYKDNDILYEYYKKDKHKSVKENIYVHNYLPYSTISGPSIVKSEGQKRQVDTFKTTIKRLSIFLDYIHTYKTNEIAIFKLISQIYTGENDTYEHYDECIYNLLLSVNEFIKIYPEVFNVKNDIEGIYEVFNKCYKEMYNNNDILYEYYKKDNNKFAEYYVKALEKMQYIKEMPNSFIYYTDFYETTIERVEKYMEYIVDETK